MDESTILTDTPKTHAADESAPVARETADLPAVRGKLRSAQRCEVGAVRERNEDACIAFLAEFGGRFSLQPVGLFLVADGMGGHVDGHLASHSASRRAAQYVLEHLCLPVLGGDELPSDDEVLTLIEAAVQAAHATVHDPDPLHDAGTTLTMALVLGQKVFLAHVGDSRAYWLVGDGRFEALTSDHSLVQRLQDVGKLTAEEAQNYQYRNILLRALGQEEDLEIDTAVYPLPPQGKLLLCSDGLCGLVGDDALHEIVAQNLTTEAIAAQLYEAAMKAGGYDNITAVVVEFEF